MLDLIPDACQLWIATHSTGFVRKAVELSSGQNNVAFLDFSGHNFDETVNLTPTKPNRSFFLKMYDVLQDDLAGLVAPDRIVLCEGSKATDAKLYSRIFEEDYPDTLFVARGSASTVEKGDVIPVLEAVVPNVRVWRLIDRDDMPDPTRDQKIIEGIRVLRQAGYLLHPQKEVPSLLFMRRIIGPSHEGQSGVVIEPCLSVILVNHSQSPPSVGFAAQGKPLGATL